MGSNQSNRTVSLKSETEKYHVMIFFHTAVFPHRRLSEPGDSPLGKPVAVPTSTLSGLGGAPLSDLKSTQVVLWKELLPVHLPVAIKTLTLANRVNIDGLSASACVSGGRGGGGVLLPS